MKRERTNLCIRTTKVKVEVEAKVRSQAEPELKC